MFSSIFTGPRKFYVAIPPGGSSSPTPTPSIQCLNFTLDGGTDPSGRTFTFTDCDNISRTITVPSGSTASYCIQLPYSATGASSTTPCSGIPPVPTPTPTPSTSIICSNSTILDLMQQAALQFTKTSVVYYKLNLSETKRNIYGESLEKWFYQPFIIKCSFERDPTITKDEMFGTDVARSLKITAPKSIFSTSEPEFPIPGSNILPEIGDIILDRSVDIYYEIHNIVVNYIPVAAANININCPPVNLITYDLICHQTRVTKLNLLPYKTI
jgi:hypothetical protein